MNTFPSFGEKPARPQTTHVPWKYLAGLLACAAVVFVFTFGVAMVGFGLGVSGGIAPFVSRDNEAKLAWHSAPIAVAAEEPAPAPTIVRPRRAEKTPPPEMRIVQASVSASDLPADVDWQSGWAPSADDGSVEDMTDDELLAPEITQN